MSWPEQSAWRERARLPLWIERERLFVLWMHGAATRDWVVRVLTAVSRVGDGWLWYIVIAALPWAGGPVGGSAAARMIGVGLIDVVIYRIIKRWIARPRPFRTCPEIRECTRSLDEFSFPSGHTLHSVAFSYMLTAYYPMFAWFVWPFTLLLAASRMILGLHYPSDVIVGALIGFSTAALSFNLL
ncbi:MAG: phosphatase PAP2 family protein [Pseudomonadota bacterium]|nr:phosphatase PAP2 family protein [Pseudomonadota bacterium]